MNVDQLENLIKFDIELMKASNLNSNYISRAINVLRSWGKTGLLANFNSPYVCRQISFLLENINSDKTDNHNNYRIPAIVRGLNPDIFMGFNLVSIQTLSSLKDVFYSQLSDGRVLSNMVTVRTGVIGKLAHPGVEGLAEYALSFANSINNSIFQDLCIVANYKHDIEFKNEETFFDNLNGAINLIGIGVGRNANWLITNRKMVNRIKIHNDFSPVATEGQSDIKLVGSLKNVKIYCNDVLTEDKILFGYYDQKNPYFSGYVYCPYTLVFAPDGAGMFRYDKKIQGILGEVDATKFYAVVNIKNIPEEEIKEEIKETVEVEIGA